MSEDIAKRSKSFLKEERELFVKAMIYQSAAIKAATRDAPITEDGLRAAVVLACYTFDLLLCGWNSLIHGFYAVAFHSVRSIDQAMVTEVAVTLDSNIASKFWRDELIDGDASKALQRRIEQEDTNFGEEWGNRRMHIRNLYHKFMHPSRTAVSRSIIIADDRKSAMPTFGGCFDEKQCLLIGRLYANIAFDAAVNTTQAFKTVLPSEGELERQFDELVELGKPLKDRWEKEMGYA